MRRGRAGPWGEDLAGLDAASRLAVWIRRAVTSDAEERVPTGGELTLFEAVGRWA
jgi:hypothetical protein